MRSASTIPKSQKPRIRAIALAAWVEAGGDFDTACVLIGQRMSRDIGGNWVIEATTIGHAFCVYWDQNNISDPAAVLVCGEPGSDFFESDDE